MIEQFIQFAEQFLLPLGAAGVFTAAFLEEVVAPIPSAAVMMGSGFFFLAGPWSAELFMRLIFSVALPISCGVTLGSLVIYGLMYASGKPAFERWGKWLGLSWSDIEKAERHFTEGKRDEAILFALRAIPIVPSVAISAFCGLVRLNVSTYVIFTFIGSFVRAILLGLAGWQLGNVYTSYAGLINRVEDTMLTVIVGAVIIAILARAYILIARKRMQ